MLQWLISKNCSWNARTFVFAARYSTLEVMKWLKKNGCPWNEFTFYTAATRGDLVHMKWLKDNDCQWDANCYVCFAGQNKSRSKATKSWLKANGCPTKH